MLSHRASSAINRKVLRSAMGVLRVKPVCLIAARHPSGSSFKMTCAVPAAFFRCEHLPHWLCNHGPDIASVRSRSAPSYLEQWRSLQQSVTIQGPCLRHRAVPVQLRGLEVRRVAPEARASLLTARELRGLIVHATLSAILTSGRPDETLIMWISWAQFVHAPAGYGTSSR